MSYIAINSETNTVYYSKGADKLAKLIGISPKTIIRNANSILSVKQWNGYSIAKCKEVPNADRGTNIKAKSQW